MSEIEPTFTGEVMLAGWKESHTSGATVTFWLPDAESLDVFRALTVRKGNTAGQRFMAVLVQIGEDEKPVRPAEQSSPAERKALAGRGCAPAAINKVTTTAGSGEPLAPPVGGEVSKWLAMRSQEEPFQQFLRRQYDAFTGGDGAGWGDVTPEQFRDGLAGYMRHAALVLCECETSRAEIDHDLRKRELWRERIRDPWLAQQRITKELPQ